MKIHMDEFMDREDLKKAALLTKKSLMTGVGRRESAIRNEEEMKNRLSVTEEK